MTSEGRIIPLKYEVEDGVHDPKTIQIKCTDEGGQENKEECPNFSDGKPFELPNIILQNHGGAKTKTENLARI